MPGLVKLEDCEDAGRNEGAEHKSGDRGVGRVRAAESQVGHRGQAEVADRWTGCILPLTDDEP